MIRVGHAQKAAIDYAKIWRCLVCVASQMPGAPHLATATLRPCGFNGTVVADLKYVKDSKGKTWVALNMVDAGTCWHFVAMGCQIELSEFGGRIHSRLWEIGERLQFPYKSLCKKDTGHWHWGAEGRWHCGTKRWHYQGLLPPEEHFHQF